MNNKVHWETNSYLTILILCGKIKERVRYNIFGLLGEKKGMSKIAVFIISICGGAIFGSCCVGNLVGIGGLAIGDACAVSSMVMGLIVAITASFGFTIKRHQKNRKNIDKDENV